MLLLTALIWGCAFVAQSTAMDLIGPFTFQGVRSVIGSAVLIPVIMLMDGLKKKEGTYKKPSDSEKRVLLTGGIICGVIMCVASNLQQFGIMTTDPGKAGFITAMYILIVPVLGLFLKKRVPPRIWLCILAALAGLFFLCVNSGTGFSVSGGDIFVFLCAIVFSIHILAVDHYAPLVDGVRLSCIQFFVSGVLSMVLMFTFEKPSVSSLVSAAVPILYAGIGSCGIAYTLQILGQKYTKPTVASLLMSLESVFAVLAQIVILRIIPSDRETFGCILMFAAIIAAQLPERRKAKEQVNM